MQVNSLINKYISWLNENKVSFSIQDLCEENETDYVLLFVDQKQTVVVKVGYTAGEVYFLRVEDDRKNSITSVFSERQSTKYIPGKNILI